MVLSCFDSEAVTRSKLVDLLDAGWKEAFRRALILNAVNERSELPSNEIRDYNIAVARRDSGICRHARIARADATARWARMPRVDDIVELHARICATPRRARDLIPKVACTN